MTIRKELPGLRGFSERNIKNMRTFYEEWSVIEVGDSAVVTAELPHITPMQGIVASDFPTLEFLSIGFTCHCSILTKVKDTYYCKACLIFMKWKGRQLLL